MLQLSGAGKRFGKKLFFEDANWHSRRMKTPAWSAATGRVKSTLLKIIAGVESLDRS